MTVLFRKASQGSHHQCTLTVLFRKASQGSHHQCTLTVLFMMASQGSHHQCTLTVLFMVASQGSHHLCTLTVLFMMAIQGSHHQCILTVLFMMASQGSNQASYQEASVQLQLYSQLLSVATYTYNNYYSFYLLPWSSFPLLHQPSTLKIPHTISFSSTQCKQTLASMQCNMQPLNELVF